MNRSFFYLVLIAVVLVAPGFQCGTRPPYENCNQYTTDTAIFNVSVANQTNIAVMDTIQIQSIISDTIQTTSGNQFQYEQNLLSCNIQAYKVVNNGNGPVLNYANNEFNPLVFTGLMQNTPSIGFGYIYNRFAPFNELRAGLVAGRPGLFLITTGANNGYYENYIPSYSPCVQIKSMNFVPIAQQNTNIWDSLGTTSLMLAGNYSPEPIANKSNRNYFFVRVRP